MFVIEQTVGGRTEGSPALFPNPYAAAESFCNRIKADRNPGRVAEKLAAGVPSMERERGTQYVLWLHQEEPLAYAARRLQGIRERLDTLDAPDDERELVAVAKAAHDVLIAALESLVRLRTEGGSNRV